MTESYDFAKLEKLLQHIDGVNRNCRLLGKRLIEEGEVHLGHCLIARGMTHDNSKFYGLEWDWLTMTEDDHKKKKDSKDTLWLAIRHHHSMNPHHPEFHPEVNDMSRLDISEMVCDWKARSEEFGSSLEEFVERAIAKYEIAPNGRVGKHIKLCLNLLLDKPFKSIKPTKKE
jgi:hypothetical protein